MYFLLFGERPAEIFNTTIGTAYPEKEVRSVDVKGRDLVTGVPKTLEITSEEVRGAISGPINAIVESVKTTLERTPPELAADIVDQGIVLAGGGALLRNLDVLLREETGLPIVVAESPLTAVVMGSGMALDELSLLKEVAIDF
jgi:rod shape-determining protein MreB